MYIYIYIYTDRERERERERLTSACHVLFIGMILLVASRTAADAAADCALRGCSALATRMPAT